MKNSADLGGCYPPRPSASVDSTLLDLQNSSYPTQPHSIIAKYIGDITCPRVDIKFTFECSTRYLTSERSERVRYRVEHEKIKFASTSGYVIFCLLYKYQWKRRDLLCNHNDGDLFTCEDNMIFWRMKIWSYFTGVYIYFYVSYNTSMYAVFKANRAGTS